MRVPPNAWPDTPASRGTLFFAQSAKVFLDQETFEGFRAYSLDTISRLDEIVAVASDVLVGRIPHDTLNPLLAELVWSLKADVAAQSIVPLETHLTIELFQKKIDARQVADFARLLRKRLYPTYRDKLKQAVASNVNDPNARNSLLSSTGFLISHLINDGHDRNFLQQRLKERFFSEDIKKVGGSVVRSFIDTLSRGGKEYLVCYGADEFAKHALTDRENWTIKSFGDLPLHVQPLVLPWSEHRYSDFAIRRQSSADPYAAAATAENDLIRIRSFFVIPEARLDLNWSKQCAVFRPRGKKVESLVHIDTQLQQLHPGKRDKFGMLVQTASLHRKMEKDFDKVSTDRLNRALATAAIATRIHLDEPRLLSLWSSFEVLLNEPDQNDVRILHFVKQIVPAVCIRYHRKVFGAVYGELSGIYGNTFSKIIWKKDLGVRGAAINRLAKIIILPELNDSRKEILEMCKANPLALNRLYRLEHLYSRPKAMRDTLVGHANRVEWQLHRIYRVRNSLVHAGMAPPYVDTLVRNAMDYFRTVVTNATRVASREQSPADLGLIFSEIGMEWEMLLRKLSNSGRHFSDDLVHEVFKGL